MRVLKIAILSLLALIVLAAGGGALFVVSIEPEDVKRFVEEKVLEETGRRLTIAGPLDYQVSTTPSISLEDVTFQNMDWASGGENMLEVGNLQVNLDLGDLLNGVLKVESLFLEHVRVTLQRRADGSANWLLGAGFDSEERDDEPLSILGTRVTPIFKSVTVIDVELAVDDALDGRKHNVDVDLIDLDAPALDSPVEAIIRMSVDGRSVDIVGNLPPAVSLGDAKAAQPFDLSGEALGAMFSASGKLLFAYEDGKPANIAVQDLKASAFGSDLAGDFSVDLGRRVPVLAANLRSDLIDTRELEGFLRAKRSGGAPAAESRRPMDDIRDLVDEEVSAEWLNDAELDLSLSLKALRTSSFEATDVSAHARMRQGRLQVSPFWAVYEGSPIKLEAVAEASGRGIKVSSSISIAGADFDRLFGVALDTTGFEAGGNLEATYEAVGGTVGALIDTSRLNLKASLPSLRYSNPTGPDWSRHASASKVSILVDVQGAEIQAFLDLLDELGTFSLDSPLKGRMLKGLNAEARVTAAELTTVEDTIQGVDISFSLRDEVLTVSAPELILAKARLSAMARVDRVGQQVRASSELLWKDVDLGILTRRFLTNGSMTGEADFDIKLEGRGRTVASLLTSIDGRIDIAMGNVAYERPNPEGGRPHTAKITELVLSAPSMSEPFTGRFSGSVEGEPLDLRGSFPSLKALVDQGSALPFAVTGTAKDKEVAVAGNLTLVQVGDRFASFGITGLDATVGDSDIAGDIKVSFEGERPKASVVLKSEQLDLEPYLEEHFGPPAAKQENAGDDVAKAVSELLDKPFPADLLDRADADLDFKAGELRLPGIAAFEVDLRAQLKDRVLTVYPSSGVFNEGQMQFEGKVDGSKAPLTDFTVAGTWNGAHFGNLLREYFDTDILEGYGNASVDLTARGSNPREAMDTLNGHAAIYMKDGRVTNTYWEFIAADLASTLLPFIGKTKEQEGKLNCMASRFNIKDGVADSVVFLVDSSRVTVGGDGIVNLKDETVDFLLHPKPKDFSFVSLATPIRISGPMADPTILPDAAGAAKGVVLGAGAMALTTINPLVLMIPLISAGSTDDPCPAAIALAEGKSPEEAAKIGEDAKKNGAPANGAEKAVNGVTKLPGKAVDGLFGGIKKLLE